MATNNLPSNHALILLGGNTPDTHLLFIKAIYQIKAEAGQLIQKSSIYQSKAWGFESDHLFINQVLEIKCSLTPERLLKIFQNIEKNLGRIRTNTKTYESRGIDIDILFFGSRIIQTEALTIPHPRLHLRRFTLVPLCEYWDLLMHPTLKRSMAELLSTCNDDSEVRLTNSDLK